MFDTDAVNLPANHPLVTGATSNSLLVQSYAGVRGERLPIWLMRQAGRSLPEYREIRKNVAMLDSCLMPELATQITLQPVRRHGVDAAIFFSDIVVPLKLAGVDVSIQPGIGPVMGKPVRSREALQQLTELTQEQLTPIVAAVRLTVAELGQTPLIGFGGAPFTLASYLIEGGPSKELPACRHMMAHDPQLFHDILGYCSRITAAFMRAQVLAGASAVQLFDSWAGRLGLSDYQRFAAVHSKELFQSLQDLPVAKVHFGVHNKALLVPMYQTGATVMGVDYETTLDYAAELLRKETGQQVPLQGNINPDFLAQDWEALSQHTLSVISDGKAAVSHVVNLGHGVPPTTNPDTITRLVHFVQDQSAR